MITLGVTDLDRSIRFYRDGLVLPQMESHPPFARLSWGNLFQHQWTNPEPINF